MATKTIQGVTLNVIAARNIKNGKQEIWEATTEDGTWAFCREELPGTPWTILHKDLNDPVQTSVPSLEECIALLTDGTLDATASNQLSAPKATIEQEEMADQIMSIITRKFADPEAYEMGPADELPAWVEASW
ncbi:MAG: hypothetical protein ACR2M4_05565 [Actinomycetota bacterium]